MTPAHSETVQQRPVSATGSGLTVLTSTWLRGPRDDENGVSAEPRQLREEAHLSGWFQSEDNWPPTVGYPLINEHPFLSFIVIYHFIPSVTVMQ